MLFIPLKGDNKGIYGINSMHCGVHPVMHQTKEFTLQCTSRKNDGRKMIITIQTVTLRRIYFFISLHIDISLWHRHQRLIQNMWLQFYSQVRYPLR